MATEDGRITDKTYHGDMISLTCVNHPNKRWLTKNIMCIGARSIIWVGMDNYQRGELEECDCPITDLKVVEE